MQCKAEGVLLCRYGPKIFHAPDIGSAVPSGAKQTAPRLLIFRFFPTSRTLVGSPVY